MHFAEVHGWGQPKKPGRYFYGWGRRPNFFPRVGVKPTRPTRKCMYVIGHKLATISLIFFQFFRGFLDHNQLEAARKVEEMYPWTKRISVWRRHVELTHRESPLLVMTMQHRSRVLTKQLDIQVGMERFGLLWSPICNVQLGQNLF